MILKIKAKIALLCLKFGKNYKRLSDGTILLEMAIGISILGIISGFFITKTITANRAIRSQQTKNNIENITSAIAGYLATNHRLPRPSSNNNGLESEDVYCCVGTVPYNALGIPYKNTLDIKARPLRYIVNINLTDNFPSIYENYLTMDGKCFCKSLPTTITINSQQHSGDIIAFVIDTENNKPIISGQNISIAPSHNTFYIRRNALLIQYLKSKPCQSKVEQSIDNSEENDMFDGL